MSRVAKATAVSRDGRPENREPGPDETYLRALKECFNEDVRRPLVTRVERRGASLHAIAFDDAPDADYFTVFSAGVAELSPPPGEQKFELLLVMRDGRAGWVDWFDRFVAEVPLESCRPGALFTRLRREDLGMSAVLAGPPHRRVLSERRLLNAEGEHVRFLQLYPLFGVEEVSSVEAIGPRAFMRSAWAQDPTALFDPRRRRFSFRSSAPPHADE